MLLYLIFVSMADEKVGGRDIAKKRTLYAIKIKLISFIDDPAFLTELAICQFLDPRKKGLTIWRHIWSESEYAQYFYNMRREYDTF